MIKSLFKKKLKFRNVTLRLLAISPVGVKTGGKSPRGRQRTGSICSTPPNFEGVCPRTSCFVTIWLKHQLKRTRFRSSRTLKTLLLQSTKETIEVFLPQWVRGTKSYVVHLLTRLVPTFLQIGASGQWSGRRVGHCWGRGRLSLIRPSLREKGWDFRVIHVVIIPTRNLIDITTPNAPQYLKWLVFLLLTLKFFPVLFFELSNMSKIIDL